MDQILKHDDFISKHDWKGLHPQKWEGGKLHIKPKDHLNSAYEPDFIQFRGKRNYPEKISEKYEYKPHNRQFKQNSNEQFSEKRLGQKHINFVPTQNKERMEKKHLSLTKNGHLEDIKYGIKTYDYSNQTRGVTWELEQQMNQKQRLDYLEDKRNQINCNSLGDKAYRFPEYSADFYKQEGLIPGSTIQKRPTKKTSEKVLVSARTEGKLTWKERQEKDKQKEEQDAVDELDQWVEDVLKEANPNYQDPDLFFERMEQKEEAAAPKGGAAAASKGAAAKKGKK